MLVTIIGETSDLKANQVELSKPLLSSMNCDTLRFGFDYNGLFDAVEFCMTKGYSLPWVYQDNRLITEDNYDTACFYSAYVGRLHYDYNGLGTYSLDGDQTDINPFYKCVNYFQTTGNDPDNDECIANSKLQNEDCHSQDSSKAIIVTAKECAGADILNTRSCTLDSNFMLVPGTCQFTSLEIYGENLGYDTIYCSYDYIDAKKKGLCEANCIIDNLIESETCLEHRLKFWLPGKSDKFIPVCMYNDYELTKDFVTSEAISEALDIYNNKPDCTDIATNGITTKACCESLGTTWKMKNLDTNEITSCPISINPAGPAPAPKKPFWCKWWSNGPGC